MNAVSTSVRVPDVRLSQPPPWNVLVVDDEPEVHAVTKLALRNFRFADRHLNFLTAHSAAEAEALLRENGDIAVMLLDV